MRIYEAAELHDRFDLLFGEDTLLKRAQERMLMENSDELVLYGDRIYATVSTMVHSDRMNLSDVEADTNRHILLFCSVAKFRVGEVVNLCKPKDNGKGFDKYVETIQELSPLSADLRGQWTFWQHVSKRKGSEEVFINIQDFFQPIEEFFDDDFLSSLVLEMIFDFNDIWTKIDLLANANEKALEYKVLPFRLMRKALQAIPENPDDHSGFLRLARTTHGNPQRNGRRARRKSSHASGTASSSLARNDMGHNNCEDVGCKWRFDGESVSYVRPTFSDELYRGMRKHERVCLECRKLEKMEKQWSCLLDSFVCSNCGCTKACVYEEVIDQKGQIDLVSVYRDLQREQVVSYMNMVEKETQKVFSKECENSFTLPILLCVALKDFKWLPDKIPGYDERRVNLDQFLKESELRRMEQDRIDELGDNFVRWN